MPPTLSTPAGSTPPVSPCRNRSLDAILGRLTFFCPVAFDSLYLPMIESISHVTFIVKDVERTARLFRAVFDAEEVYDSAGKNFSISYEKFFVIGGTWIVVMEGDSLSDRSYNHVAFKVPEDEFDRYVSRVKQLNLEVKPGRDRIEGEARSLYFYDYDNHLFELHTGSLEERLFHYGRKY